MPQNPSHSGATVRDVLLLQKLNRSRISYILAHVRDDAITIQTAVPGQRWEIDVFSDGGVEFEVFASDGRILDESRLDGLLHEFSDA